jgi:hypothetical protein
MSNRDIATKFQILQIYHYFCEKAVVKAQLRIAFLPQIWRKGCGKKMQNLNIFNRIDVSKH